MCMMRFVVIISICLHREETCGRQFRYDFLGTPSNLDVVASSWTIHSYPSASAQMNDELPLPKPTIVEKVIPRSPTMTDSRSTNGVT